MLVLVTLMVCVDGGGGDGEGLMNFVWMFFKLEGYPSKPLMFNSPKLGEFGGGGEQRAFTYV
jgi:hypothetical protein